MDRRLKSSDVSVIVPVRNGENTLVEFLDALKRQDHPSFEVIIVDNNSSDRTATIAKRYADVCGWKYVFHEKVGRASARNRGILESSGSIIAMTDCDCLVDSSWLSNITKPILQKNEVAIGSEESVSSNYWASRIQQSIEQIRNNAKNGNYINYFDTKNCAMTAKLAKEYLFDESLVASEDLEFYLRIDRPIYYDPSVKVRHMHSSNIIQVINMQLRRARNCYYLRRKFPHKCDPMFDSLSLWNNVVFPSWLLFQLIKRPKDFPYIFTTEASWRIGLLLGIATYHWRHIKN